MDWGIFWGAVGALAAVASLAGLYFAWRTYRRQFAKREIRYTVKSVPLIRDGAAHAKLRVMRGDVELQDPYLLTVAVESASRADIATSAFDDDNPLDFEVNPPMLVTDTSTTTNSTIGFTWADQDIDGGATVARIDPQLIRKRATGAFSAVTDGRPSVTVRSPLIDIPVAEIRAVDRTDRRGLVTVALIATALSLALSVSAVVAALL
ncbi:hypothetical protein GCM10009775_04530 [Microbacterium aoyamense]|uniref:RING-type E3 ubiquitin transferase n=1 Tax=Microbacterium aoyamense TaxID=344166 RepID=A0ABN2P921_9MICO|nr:hypothetical protein [Microbacterium aoyamense]